LYVFKIVFVFTQLYERLRADLVRRWTQWLSLVGRDRAHRSQDGLFVCAQERVIQQLLTDGRRTLAGRSRQLCL